MLEDASLAQAWPGVEGRRPGREDQRGRSDNSNHLTNNPIRSANLARPSPAWGRSRFAREALEVPVRSQRASSPSLQLAPSGLLPQTGV